jgi:histone H3/H4
VYINSDINVLGGLSDFSIINAFLIENLKAKNSNDKHQAFTSIKSTKSYKRFEHAINNTLLKFRNNNLEVIIRKILDAEKISFDSLLVLFWNASINNEFLDYLNEKVYFPAFYSGRVTIKKDDVVACLSELKQTETALQKWSDSSINVTASKYLTLLKKFNLMEGGQTKTISHNYLSDKLLIIFVYWLLAVETKSNILESRWLEYCFSEKEIFIQRILEKKFMKFFNINYSGDKLMIETNISYEELYDELSKS